MAHLTGFLLFLTSLSWFALSLLPSEVSPDFARKGSQTCEIPTPKGGKRHDCYDRKCWCTKTRANCSDNKGSLLFVPRLPRGIQFLDLSYDNLSTIPQDFFANVTNLTSVSLSTNFIASIAEGAFEALKRLEVVFLDNNFHLTGEVLKPVFESKTLKCVDLRYGKLKTLPKNAYESPNLEKFYLHDEYVSVVNFHRFESSPKLRVLGWSGNYVMQIIPGLMRKLKFLYLSNNLLSSFPDTCIAKAASFFPRLTLLNLKNNKIHSIPSQLCLPRLQRLDLSGNLFQYMSPNTFHLALFPQLNNLYLEAMDIHITNIDAFVFNNTHLKMISLMYNNLKFSDEESIAMDSFAGCPNLQRLQLSSNVFSGVSDERFLGLFGNLTRLDTIYMGKTSLERITVRTFAKFPRLKILFLYLNKVSDIPDGAFAGNPLLKELNLNDNRVTTVTRTTFTEANRHSLKQLDLSGNPFSCDCDLLWFSDWLRSNKTLFKHSRSSYYCSNLHQEVASFTVPDQACLLSPDTSEFIVVSVSLLLMAMTLVSAVFRYRWHIRLLLYEAFRGRDDVRRRRLEEGNFDYDVFVSYASGDLSWVYKTAMPELENRLGLRLCVHDRDFIPGNNIVDNIADCVESSKKILMVFSNHFLRSQWCQFELAYCLRHVMDYDDALIVVCLGDVASRDLTSSMMAVMKTTTYIQWVDDDDAIASFWGRLKEALQEVVPNRT
ncbi:toll-like receptor 13 [Littorina saxatilis]|uniref:TIR domain-containing protein n=1 Tax=Littorina saxatilis TaxID=31220 RepID=A0AAN9ARM8_9CAEN